MTVELIEYASLLDEIKGRIRRAQTRAILSANREMLGLYWEVGRLIRSRQEIEGWGSGVIPRLARDLRNELPETKGFSERNLDRMIRFYREYPMLMAKGPKAVALLDQGGRDEISPQPVAKMAAAAESMPLAETVLALPWGHNSILIAKVEDLRVRCWYMEQALAQGWSRNVLDLMIKSKAHERQGEATTNFEARLPEPQSDLAQQALKDPYVFDFLTLDKPFRERELETGLIAHLERFMLELGIGFAFVGRQYHLSVGKEDFSE